MNLFSQYSRTLVCLIVILTELTGATTVTNDVTTTTITSVTPTLTGVLSAAPTTPHVNTSVCYEHVGCFNNSPPFDNVKLLLPQSPDDIGFQLFLYTRTAPVDNDTYEIDYTDMSRVKNSTFNPAHKTTFVTHGFANDNTTEWLYELKDALLERDDMNVVMVMWGPGAAFPDYTQAVANTRIVARLIHLFIVNLVAEFGVNYKDFHLIGHSLGAHTSGHVGQMLRTRNVTLGRITGLDPAEPNFKDHPTVIRLDKNDADFVDVIHTNGAPFSSGGAGLFEPCGDVDFYVNGGEVQPDCPSQVSGFISHLGDLFNGNFDALSTAVSCSHSRSHEVFMESINAKTCRFTAYPCDGYVEFQNGQCLKCGLEGCSMMGYDSPNYFARGMLFMNTRQSTPFCGHHYNVLVEMATDGESAVGKIEVKLNGSWGVSEWLTITRTDRLSRGSRHSRVVVAENVVGTVQSVHVRYTKMSGLFSRGPEDIQLQHIAVQSGESGERFVVDIDHRRKFKTGVEVSV